MLILIKLDVNSVRLSPHWSQVLMIQSQPFNMWCSSAVVAGHAACNMVANRESSLKYSCHFRTVVAVAGNDYCIVAGSTRLSTGFSILTRERSMITPVWVTSIRSNSLILLYQGIERYTYQVWECNFKTPLISSCIFVRQTFQTSASITHLRIIYPRSAALLFIWIIWCVNSKYCHQLCYFSSLCIEAMRAVNPNQPLIQFSLWHQTIILHLALGLCQT